MKGKLMILSIMAACLMLLTGRAAAQNTGDYQTAQSGKWNVLTTWQVYNGSAWVSASVIPDYVNVPATNVITILSGHTVTFMATDTLRNVVVAQGGTLIDSLTTGDGKTTDTLRFATPGITINGTFTVAGNVTQTAAPYGIVYGGTVAVKDSLHIGGTGAVNVNETSATTSTKGFLPAGVWATGSTLTVNGIGGTAATGWGSGNSQNFGNINYNVTGAYTGNFGWGFASGNVVSGNFTVLATNNGTTVGRLQLAGGSSGSVRINGNLTVTGGYLTGSGTGTSATYDTVYVMGNVKVTSGGTTGGFAVDRGSHGNANDHSGVVWYFYGDSVTIATTSTNANNLGNSNSQSSTYPYYLDSRFVFAKAGTQYAKITPTNCTSTYGLNFDVIDGAQVNMIATSNIIYLRLIDGKIISPTATPLVSGWYTGSALYSGTIENTSTSYVDGNLGILVASASGITKTFPIGKGSAYRPVTLSLTESAATSTTYYAEMFLGNANLLNSTTSTDLNHVSYKDYYKIAESGGGSAFTAGAVTLNYGTQGVDDEVWDPGATRVVQGPSSPGTWIDLGPAGTPNKVGPPSQTGTITSSVAFTDLTDTYFALGSTTAGSDSPLPVEMTSFTATASASDGTTLHWSMSSELNNSGWDVQRATVDANGNVSAFTKIGYVKGSTNSVEATTYSFVDRTALYGTFEYRLNQIDINGGFKFTNPIKVAQLELPKSVELGAYPNPFNPTATLRYALPEAGSVAIAVYNSIGQLVTTLLDKDMDAGIFEVSFNASNLPSGLYFARLSFAGKENNTVRISKMMLVK